jgi:hypothetical protein
MLCISHAPHIHAANIGDGCAVSGEHSAAASLGFFGDGRLPAAFRDQGPPIGPPPLEAVGREMVGEAPSKRLPKRHSLARAIA